MTTIAPTAHIDPSAEIAEDVEIGHNCFVGPRVTLGPGCILYNNVTLIGRTTVGRQNTFFQNAVIGAVPQDLKYKGGDTQIVIGDGNTFRENVTVHLGTELGGGTTRIGSHNLLMAGVHIAHDCCVGDRVLLANNALVAGHVTLEDSTVIGGGAGLHHFVTVGRNAMVGGLTRVICDVPPFMIFEGNPGSVRGINVTGLVRNQFTPEQIQALKQVYKKLFRGGQILRALDELEQSQPQDENIRYLVEFLRRSFQGKHGRYLEATRTDKAEDLASFYRSDRE